MHTTLVTCSSTEPKIIFLTPLPCFRPLSQEPSKMVPTRSLSSPTPCFMSAFQLPLYWPYWDCSSPRPSLLPLTQSPSEACVCVCVCVSTCTRTYIISGFSSRKNLRQMGWVWLGRSLWPHQSFWSPHQRNMDIEGMRGRYAERA